MGKKGRTHKIHLGQPGLSPETQLFSEYFVKCPLVFFFHCQISSYIYLSKFVFM